MARLAVTFAVVFVAATASIGCPDNTTTPPTTTTPTGAPSFQQIFTDLLQPSCTAGACHGGPTGIANLVLDDFDTAYDLLIGGDPVNGPARVAGMKLVDPGNAANSFLLHKLRASSDALTLAGEGARMPLASTEVLTAATLAQIEAWIADGAPKDSPDGAFEVAWETAPDAVGYVQCDATDEVAMRDCFPPAATDQTKLKRIYTPPMTLKPGTEHIFCNFLEVTEETLLVRKATGKQMNGGHHIGLFVSVVHQQEGLSVSCDDIDMSSLRFVIGAGGAGGLDTNLKDGLALRVRKGEQIVIQSHYINATPYEQVVMDAIDVELTTLESAPIIADSFALIDSDFEVPVGAKGFQRVKECTIDSDIELHLLLGHTHDYGVLFELEVLKQNQDPTLQYSATDGPTLRDNPEIQNYDQPIKLTKGDKLRMTCQWDNPTDHALTWPEEMCVTFMYYTPGNGWMTCDTHDEVPKITGASGQGCRLLGDEGNDKGVGKYCTPNGEECANNGDAGFCLASFSDKNNYCSVILCSDDSQCGEGAKCIVDGPGSACILDVCDE